MLVFFFSEVKVSLTIYATLLKTKYPYIKRVYVRAEYQYINEDYRKYLLENYEDTYYPKLVENAGKLSYIKRNYEMIDRSNFCMFYYNENPKIKSGTKIAFQYATKKHCKSIRNVIQ